jgi:hypothetical protein
VRRVKIRDKDGENLEDGCGDHGHHRHADVERREAVDAQDGSPVTPWPRRGSWICSGRRG